jgi:hypothetical protein
LLGVDVLRARFGRGASENILKLLPMVTPTHRALHHVAKRVNGIGLQTWRLYPVEGHHVGRVTCDGRQDSENCAR